MTLKQNPMDISLCIGARGRSLEVLLLVLQQAAIYYGLLLYKDQ